MMEPRIIREIFLGTEQPKISEIINNRLFLGNANHAIRKNVLKVLGIKRIVNISEDLPCSFPDDFEYCHIKIDDHPSANIYGYLDQIYDFIESSPGPVFVHCRMGISRSSSAVIAYVGRKFKLDYDVAYDVVKRRRQCISPNQGFREQLKMYLKLKKYTDK